MFQVVFIRTPDGSDRVGRAARVGRDNPFPQLMRPPQVRDRSDPARWSFLYDWGIVYATKRMNFVPGDSGFTKSFTCCQHRYLAHFAANSGINIRLMR